MGGGGTALGIIVRGFRTGRVEYVFQTETRPLNQGSKLSMYELIEEGVPASLVADSAVGALMRQGKINVVVVGADRVVANGDAANKIGTYQIAVLAKEHGIPFYVAAPTSTIDFNLNSGDEIKIEERSPKELTHFREEAIAPEGAEAVNLGFDVTPAKYITRIITDRGVFKPAELDKIQRS